MSIRVVVHAVGALLALSIAAADGYSAPIFITIDAPPYFIPISDGGPGDPNPANGVIGFDQVFFFQNTTGTLTEESELKGDVILQPGHADPGRANGLRDITYELQSSPRDGHGDGFRSDCAAIPSEYGGHILAWSPGA